MQYKLKPLRKIIPLGGKYGKGKFAIIDEEDYNIISKYGWFYHPNNWPDTKEGYACATKRENITNKPKTLRMHKLILNCPKGMEIDHINRNKLDNRKCNLRICTKSENRHNVGVRSNSTSGIKGISFHKLTNKWQARIQINKKRITIGLFDNKNIALQEYKKYINKLCIIN